MGRCSSFSRSGLNGPAQRACDENYRIELFEIPEFGEVKSDWGRSYKTAVFASLDQPSNSALESFLRSGDLAAANQGVNREGGFFDARRRLRSAAPTAVIALRLDKPMKPAPCGFSIEKI